MTLLHYFCCKLNYTYYVLVQKQVIKINQISWHFKLTLVASQICDRLRKLFRISPQTSLNVAGINKPQCPEWLWHVLIESLSLETNLSIVSVTNSPHLCLPPLKTPALVCVFCCCECFCWSDDICTQIHVQVHVIETRTLGFIVKRDYGLTIATLSWRHTAPGQSLI